MLKNLTIIGLFGLYDYKLDFQSKSGTPTFITGPNGYGKTTVLNIIDSLYRADYQQQMQQEIMPYHDSGHSP